MTQKNPRNKFPRITLITPSFNQGTFIEKTIQSVLSQKYPNLEYIILDGGSQDETLQILQKYKRKIRYVSKKDSGQSNAINQGIRNTSGKIIGYLNSDDYLEKDALYNIAVFFMKEKHIMWVTGKCHIVDSTGQEVRKLITVYKNSFLKFFRHRWAFYIVQYISQPATFWRRSIVDKIGLFDENLHYDMDFDYWIRIWKKYPLGFLDTYLASYRVHPFSKAVSSPETQFQTSSKILEKHIHSRLILFLHMIHDMLALRLYRLFPAK
ncbi:glycosyltransferase [Candidatus Gottesmanbacteria bacterium]|nr:glycosyltransferase [Candidatus Gottesmanbacteria bacterium]